MVSANGSRVLTQSTRLLSLIVILALSALTGCYNGFSDERGSFRFTWYTPGVYKGAQDPLLDNQVDPRQLQHLRERFANAYPQSSITNTGPATTESPRESNPRADTWRKVRVGYEGYSAINEREAGVLIQGSGQIWREIRNGPVSIGSAWLMGAVTLAIGLFLVIRGPLKLDHRSGKLIERWTLSDRVLHWLLALTFLILAFTGLTLLYGKHVLMPLLGKESFAGLAAMGKSVHNYLSPFFVVTLFVTLVSWMKHNVPGASDLRWIVDTVKGKHASAGFTNGGEKIWYWLLFVAGTLVCLSGLVLLTPSFGWVRSSMQVANILHIVGAVSLISFAILHIYLGTIGMEGSLEGMTRGKVDERWAETHHDLWYAEVRQGTAKKLTD